MSFLSRTTVSAQAGLSPQARQPERAPPSPRLRSLGVRSLLTSTLGGSALCLSIACSVATDATPVEDEARSVHALIQIRRTETIEGEEKADALASILRVPLSTDPGEVLSVAGLRETLPPIGECRATSSLPARQGPTTQQQKTWEHTAQEPAAEWRDLPFGEVELVAASEVTVNTSSGVHSLAPHAFPTVSDWLRGVVYTSRDQQADALPEGSLYAILVNGAEGLGSIDATHESPQGPSSITLGGRPLEKVREIDREGTLDLTWTPSSNSLDVMAVSLRAEDSNYTCAFSDTLGAGSVPLGEFSTENVLADEAAKGVGPSEKPFQPGGSGTLSLHRVRVEASTSETDAAVLEVRFDFSVVADVVFR